MESQAVTTPVTANVARAYAPSAQPLTINATAQPACRPDGTAGLVNPIAPYDTANAIYRDEITRIQNKIAQDAAPRGSGSDDYYDALRHSEASRHLAEAIGAPYAHLFGTAHEVQNILNPKSWMDGHVLESTMMDLHNNAEGRRAAREGRPISPQNLQTGLGKPNPSAGGFPYRKPYPY